jgi:hypothetical protein
VGVLLLAPQGNQFKCMVRLDFKATNMPEYEALGMAIQVRVPDTRRVPDPTGTGMGMIIYPWVAPVPDSSRDGYFFPPAGNLTGT